MRATSSAAESHPAHRRGASVEATETLRSTPTVSRRPAIESPYRASVGGGPHLRVYRGSPEKGSLVQRARREPPSSEQRRLSKRFRIRDESVGCWSHAEQGDVDRSA